MGKNFKLFGIFNILDLIIILVPVIAVIIIFLVNTGGFIAANPEKPQKKNVEIDVMLRGKKVSREGEIFRAGEKTFITIRNVPYTKLEIIKAERMREMVAIPDPKNPFKAIATENPVFPNTYNYLVTISDKAVITQDGAVISGNKVKIGLPITLEGYDYRMSGVVSDVRIKENDQEK